MTIYYSQHFIQQAGMADWLVAGEHINVKVSNFPK